MQDVGPRFVKRVMQPESVHRPELVEHHGWTRPKVMHIVAVHDVRAKRRDEEVQNGPELVRDVCRGAGGANTREIETWKGVEVIGTTSGRCGFAGQHGHLAAGLGEGMGEVGNVGLDTARGRRKRPVHEQDTWGRHADQTLAGSRMNHHQPARNRETRPAPLTQSALVIADAKAPLKAR